MQVIIVAIGSAGDVNPFMVIGARLKKLGHEVLIVASPHFEEKVARAGLRLLPLGTEEDFQRAVNNPELWKAGTGFAAVWKEMPESIRLTYQQIEANHQGANTILVGSTLAIGARLAQEKLKLPLATVHLAPTCILSIHGTAQSPTHPLPSWLPNTFKKSFYQFLDYAVLDRISASSLNELRASMGLPPVKNVISKYIHSPELVICAFPDWFASVQADWPPSSYTTGFTLYSADKDLPLSAELEKFLQNGEAPIVFTAGSAMAFSKQFFEQATQASQQAGRRAVLVSAFKDQIPEEVPSSILHVSYANFNALFSRAAIAVHHGGIGTSAMALASGCPQIIVPYAHDQFDNGLRIEALGAGKAVAGRASFKKLKEAIQFASDPKIDRACKLFQKRIAESKPAEDQIADLILKKLGNQAPVGS